MKKTMIIALFIPLAGWVCAQEDNIRPKKRFTTGFNVGLNKANVLLNSPTVGAAVDNGIGVRLGLVSNLAISRRFSIEPKAELSFNTSRVTDGTTTYKVNPVDVELMAHLRTKLWKGGFSPYLTAGPNVKIPLGQRSEFTLPTRNDVAIDVGVGLDVPFGKKIRVSPELRYSFGLLNISQSNSVGDLKFHNVALILNFVGRPRL